MAGLFSNSLHVPKNVDMKDRVADFWKTEATDPVKHTMRPIVTGLLDFFLCIMAMVVSTGQTSTKCTFPYN